MGINIITRDTSLVDLLKNIVALNLTEIDQQIKNAHCVAVTIYEMSILNALEKHPIYCSGWSENFETKFFGKSRCLNRVAYYLLKECKKRVLDFGCYDAMLVKLLYDIGVDAWGYDKIPWGVFYKEFNIDNRIVFDNHPQADIVIAFNIAQNYRTFTHFENDIRLINGKTPSIILFDREVSRGQVALFPNYYPLEEVGVYIIPALNCHNDCAKPDLLVKIYDKIS